MLDWSLIVGFEWDAGNERKSVVKRGVSQIEAEEAFFNAPLIVLADASHSAAETRYHALGRTNEARRLHVTFTLRKSMTLTRVISARDMSVKEGSSMKKVRRPIPTFADEAEERAFWERTDSTDHIDWSKGKPVRLPSLRPSTTAISLRLPLHLLEAIKIAANKRDVPYQSLIKMWLSEKVR